MKLSNISVIFIIIIIPIILLLSYYISLQIDTVNMQTTYNTKLLESTKEAIEAFEINTVEWNEAYSETADSKRRDIMASVNTFTTSFANAIGVSGASKETILSYVPAIAFTLYDGYYIYSPAETKVIIKDNNGVAVLVKQTLVNYASNSGRPITFSDGNYDSNNEGKILYEYDSEKGGTPDGTYEVDGETKEFTLNAAYAKITYSHILKPFTAYSGRYVNGSTDITVNYTLDNYISIYGNVEGTYHKKSGYLIDIGNIDNMPDGTISGIKLDGDISIEPETLKETIWYEGLSEPREFTYVYEAENNTKVYFDGTTPFQVSSTGKRTNLDQLSSIKYKKLSIYEDDYTCIEIYQALVGNGDNIEQGKWYTDTKSGTEVTGVYGQSAVTLRKDASAINYYVESYAFSNWVYDKLGGITVDNMTEKSGETTVTGNITGEIAVTGTIFADVENENSVFNRHKREVIKQVLISNLNQSITSYSRKSPGEFVLPVLSETDWDQILNNVSIITFVQGIPIGMKYYNNYAIATSTSNKEYVDPNEIYLNVGSVYEDLYYHLPYCKKIDSGFDLKGYRSIDYRVKSYKDGDEIKYYYMHNEISKEECYYCLVQRSLFSSDGLSSDDIKDHEIEYETALAREKYAARTTSVPNIVIADLTPDPDPPVVPDPDPPVVPDPDPPVVPDPDPPVVPDPDPPVVPDPDPPVVPDPDPPVVPDPESYVVGQVILEQSNTTFNDISDSKTIAQDGYYEIILVAGGGGGIEGSWILEEWWYLYGGGSGAGFKRNCRIEQRRV